MNPASKRVRKYRSEGGAADAPFTLRFWFHPQPARRFRRRLPECERPLRNGRELKVLLDKALRLYGPRILDNVDLDQLADLRSRVAVAARAMIDRGDARAFALGRQMLDRADADGELTWLPGKLGANISSEASSSPQNLIFESKARGVVPCEPSPSGYLIGKDLDKYGVAYFL